MFCRTTSSLGAVCTAIALALVFASGDSLHGQLPLVEVRVSPQDTSLNLDAKNYSTNTNLTTYTWPDYRPANVILMKLDMPALPAGAVIHEAKLHLRLVASDKKPDSAYAISVHKVIGKNPVINRATGHTTDGQAAWATNTCCYKSVPLAQADLSPAYDKQSIDKTPGFKTWTITSMVQEWMASPTTNRGLVLNSDDLLRKDRYRYFASMEHADPSFRPFLAIKYSAPLVDTTPPEVTVASPADGGVLVGNASVIAQASDNVGVVSVQMHLNGSPFGAAVTAPPYSWAWDTTTVSDGTYVLTAVAHDSAGNSATSPVVSATVANGIIVLQPQDTSLKIDAANYSGNSQLLAYTWPDNQPANTMLMKFDVPALPTGARVVDATLHLALVASDATADATYTMTAHKVLGAVPVIAQATGYTRNGQTAWTPNGCCSNGVPLAQGDLSPAYDTRAIDKSAGFKTWAIPAMVQEWVADPSSNAGVIVNPDLSAPRDHFRFFASMEYPDAALRPFLRIRYSVDLTPPSISITAPAAGASLAGTVNIAATASDDTGILGVQFKVDGVNLGLEDTAAPYAITWNSSSVANGAHTLSAVARDAAGNITTSPNVAVSTANDVTAPALAITAPAGGATISGTTTLTASASDNVGVVGVQFKADGVNLGSEDTAAPYTFTWNTNTVANGAHTLTAVARDAAGNVTTSANVGVSIANSDATAPAVAITAPTGGATVTGTTNIAASASDNVGVVGVQFKVNGANLGAEDTTSPYAVSWSTTTVANGVYSLTAVARDAAGNSTTSAAVSVTVQNTVIPPTGWPNEPAGYTAISDQPWNALASLSWSHQNRGATSSITLDASAPLSASNVLTHSYPVGMPGGVEPAVDWYTLPGSFTEGYVAMWWKPSSNFQNHPSNVNKIFFIFGTAGHIIPVMYGAGNGTFELRLAPEWGNWSWLTPNVNSGNVTLGQWHRIEVYFKQHASAGVIKWWMDGNLIGNYTNIAFPSSMQFQELQIAPTWGGVGATKTQQDYFWFDHVRISRPGGTPPPPPPSGSLLFDESFEDGNLASRGWYDNTSSLLSTSEHVAGSTRAIEYRFVQGATTPTAGSALRRKFTPSNSVYLSYYVKYSTNWVGSQRPYHPHEFHFLTTLDGDWSGLSNTHLTTYIEQNGGTPLIAMQDGLNVDQSKIGVNLTAVTENRAAAGCNGSSDGYPDNCYLAGNSYTNEKKFPASTRYFTDAPGPFYKNDWHFVEAFIQLNTVSNGVGVNDGIVQYWFDGQPVIDHRNVLFRTGARATQQFNQFVIAPYIGDGSPVAQSMWIDNLTVRTGRP